MRKAVILILFGILITNFSSGQDDEKYNQLVNEAETLYESKDYLESGQKYSEAFVALGNKGTLVDRYNAACSWALANLPDSSFVHLTKIAEIGNYTDLKYITSDPDLTSLHKDERWNLVIGKIEFNRKDFDEYLVSVLDTIYREDQGYRQQANEIENKYGRESEETKAHWKILIEKDSIHIVKVKNILDERGWLGADIIGNQGNQTLWLVIQHSKPETQQRYLPMLREAVNDGNAHAMQLAYLEDRVAIGKGEKQIYGSQIGQDHTTGEYYLSPLIDPDNVDKRRAEVGLDPLKDYLSNWGLTWDVEKYKTYLPEIIEKSNKK